MKTGLYKKRRRIISILLALLCFFSLIFVNAQTVSADAAMSEVCSWSNVKIGGGGMIVGIVMHPKDSNIVYARTDVGGIYRWNYENREWIPLNDSFGLDKRRAYDIGAIALDPNNVNIVYIACGGAWYEEGHLFKSVDMGQTWIESDLKTHFSFGWTYARYAGESIAVDPDNSNIVWCGTQYDGLWKSTDGGLHWTQDTQIPTGCTPTSSNQYDENVNSGIRSVVYDDNGNLYIGVNPNTTDADGTDGGVWRLKRGSEVWEYMEGSPTKVMILKPLGDKIYASSLTVGKSLQPAEIYCCENDIWTKLSTPSRIDYCLDAAVDSDGNNAIFCTSLDASGARLYSSTDDGKNWTILMGTNGDSRILPNDYWVQGLSNVQLKSIKTYKSNGKLCAWLGNGVGIYHTDDVMSTSSNYSIEINGIEELCAYKAVSTPSGGAKLFVGNMDYSGYRITDTNDYSKTQKIRNMYTSPDSANAALYPQVISDIDFCEEDPSYAACFFSTGSGVVGVGTSSDNGQKFAYYGNDLKSSYGILRGNIAVGSKVLNSGVPALVAIGTLTDGTDKNTVFYSEDFGKTWQQSLGISGPILTAGSQYQRKILASDRADGNAFYLCDVKNGYFYKSTDGGKTFEKTGLSITTQGYSDMMRCGIEANPKKAGELCFFANNYKSGKFESYLYKSTDYGSSAQKLDNVTAVEAFSYGACPQDSAIPSMFVIGKVDGVRGLYRSDNNGASWIKMNDADHGLGNAYSICGDKREYGKVYVATWGRSIMQAYPTDGENFAVIGYNLEKSGSSVICTALISALYNDVTVVPILALYDDETLVLCKISDALIVSAKTEAQVIIEAELQSELSNPKAALFFWNSIEEMIPISPKITMDLQ